MLTSVHRFVKHDVSLPWGQRSKLANAAHCLTSWHSASIIAVMTKVPTASEAIAAGVRKYRRLRGWSVRELAEKCAELGATTLTQASLTNIERGLVAKEGRGSRAVTVDEMFVLAYALSVSPMMLMLPFGEHNRIAVLPKASLDLITAFRWIGMGTAGRDLLFHDVSWGEEPALRDRGLYVLRLLADIENWRLSALTTRRYLHGDRETLLAVRREMDARWRAADPTLRTRMEQVAKENNRPLPGSPISDDEYVEEWRKALPSTYETRLRSYADALWRAFESAAVQVLPPVPALLYADLMALPAHDHINEQDLGVLADSIPPPSRPILPPGVEVEQPGTPLRDLDGDR